MSAKPLYHVVSFSGGKDSTAMVLRMIELGYKIDEVVFCDTTMEFPAMLRHVEKVRQVVEAAGVKFTILQAEHDFEYYLLQYTPKRKDPNAKELIGCSWPCHRVRWCTRILKHDVINRYLRKLRDEYAVVQYIGLAADEGYRLERANNQKQDMRHPLVEWGWDEEAALSYCYRKGYDWEGLYQQFKRVSCWCCPLQPLSELRTLREKHPDLWQRLMSLDAQTWRVYKEHGVENLDRRFELEDALTEHGISIKNRAFFTDLKRLLAGETTIESILNERKA